MTLSRNLNVKFKQSVKRRPHDVRDGGLSPPSSSSSLLGPTLLFATGDSITAGALLPGVNGLPLPNVAPESKYGAYPNQYCILSIGNQRENNYASPGAKQAWVTGQTSQIQDLAATPWGAWAPYKIETILIGTNDRSNASYFPTGEAQWLSDLFVHTEAVRSDGYKVLVGTQLPLGAATSAPYPGWDAWRAVIKTGLLAAIGTSIDGIIDFAADPEMGNLAAPDGGVYYNVDGIHPNAAGHLRLSNVYKTALNALRPPIAPPTPFPTWDTLNKGSNVVLSNGNKTASISPSGFQTTRSTTYRYYNKLYTEITLSGSSANGMVGIVDAATLFTSYGGQTYHGCMYWTSAGLTTTLTVVNATPGAYLAAGDVFLIAIDFDGGNLWFGKNGTYPLGGDPVAAVNPTATFPPGTPFFIATSPNATAFQATLPTSSFAYQVPTGFKPW